MESWDWVPASVIYGTVVGGFMFGFVRFVAKAFMKSGEPRPPNIAGTLSSLVARPPPLVIKNARQGLRFGATDIVLNEGFRRWLWRRGRRRRKCSTASVVQKINAQIAAPLGLSKKLPAQIVIVQKVKLEPCGRSLLLA
jgi:hypothetical protein